MSADSPFKPICVVYGKGRFLRREALHRIVERELAGGDRSVNLRRFDGAVATVAEVLDEVRTYTMTGGRRVVIVDDADAFIRVHRAALERFAAAPCDSGSVILVCDTFSAGTRLAKAVKKIGEAVDCKEARGRELIGWLMNRCSGVYGKRLGRAAAASLVEHAGGSQEGLDQELAKLSLYVGRRGDITSDDVEALVGRYREQKVFAVMDHVFDGEAGTALREWRQVLATDRAAAGRAIGGLGWAVRRMLDARKRLDAGESAYGLARACFTDADTLTRRMQGTTVADWEDQLLDLLDADLAAKTGLGTFASAVEKFIVKHGMAASQP